MEGGDSGLGGKDDGENVWLGDGMMGGTVCVY